MNRLLNRGMSLLTERRLVALIGQMERDYRLHRPFPSDDILQPYRQPARLEFPLGELMNARITGFVWAWRMTDRLQVTRIQRRDRFNANGLEGKCVISPLELSTALLAARELPAYRRAVYVHKKFYLTEVSP